MASRQRVQKLDRMGATGLWRWSRLLLLLLYVSGFQAVSIMEKKVCLIEGNNLTEICPYNIMKYASSLKAWQRVRSQGPPETLVRTKTRNTDINQAQAGRYLLEDFPTEAVVKVTVTGLQRQDKGLYQCVIDLSPRDPVILHDRIRLVHCDDSSGTTVLNKNPIQTLVETTTLPLTTATMTPRTPLLRPRTVTKPLSTSTAIFSSPGLRNNFTNVGDVTRSPGGAMIKCLAAMERWMVGTHQWLRRSKDREICFRKDYSLGNPMGQFYFVLYDNYESESTQ